MKFSFIDYLFEIWTIAKVRNVDVGVAFDMFRTDIENGKALPFNTGNALPSFDFARLKTRYDALSIGEQKDAITEYSECVSEHYISLCEVYDALSE